MNKKTLCAGYLILITLSYCRCSYKTETPHYFEPQYLNEFIKQYPVVKAHKNNLQIFYTGNHYSFAWFDHNGLNEYAENFIQRIHHEKNVLPAFYCNRLDDLYNAVSKKKYKFKSTDSTALRLELFLTAGFFEYAKNNWEDMGDGNFKKTGWLIQCEKLDYPAVLDSLLKADSREIAVFEPLCPQFKLLKRYAEKYAEEDSNGGWPSPGLKITVLKKGTVSPEIPGIKKLLFLVGDLHTNDESTLFDDTLEKAVRKFQGRHGLEQDGIIAGKTLAAMRVSLSERRKQIAFNMQRCRCMPIYMRGDNIRVNIPEYMLYVYENDNLQWTCEVVVGNDSNNTTVFSDYMEKIVFSPYWHVPRSILFKETIPAVKENPDYLAAHDMEVTDEAGNAVDPSQVDWDVPEEKFHYMIRQKPGSDNSLGRVKFLLPNSHSIYLHDTPAKSLFGENERAFSHGCIRVSEPLKLAQYLLRHHTEWSADSIRSAMYGEKEITVKLPEKVPVYITYFTAWVDANGDLNFREDIYEHDEKMKKLLPL